MKNISSIHPLIHIAIALDRQRVVKSNTIDSGYWYLGNIMAAKAILDDLEKYLLNQDLVLYSDR